MMTAAKRYVMANERSPTFTQQKERIPTLGLYSAFRAWRAIVFRSSRQSKLTVATIFCNVGTIPSTAVMCCCSRVRAAGVAGTDVAGGVEGPATAVD
jgi:hypothetical protein